MVTKIVIGVDGTPASTKASEVGIRLAASMNADILFVHFSRVADKLFEEDPDNGPSQDRLEKADPVLGAAAAAARAAGVAAELMVQDEHGASMIAANLAGVAEGIDAELVVVGNRGRNEVAEIVLGSVVHQLLGLSARPVVVVHAGKDVPT